MGKRTRRKLTLNDMKEWAAERGGSCLSQRYVHSQVKLEWKCDKGHVWDATPMCIYQGRWCPVCARLRNRNPALALVERKEGRVHEVKSGWDANVMLAQRGWFFLRDVCQKIPFSDQHIAYYVKRYPEKTKSAGIHVDSETGRQVVFMPDFARWVDGIWNSG